MSHASQIVNALLEADEPPLDVDIDKDADPLKYLHAYADDLERDEREGKVTLQTALKAHYFWHRTLKYSDGRRALQARKNGNVKTWKTRPGEFQIPMKFGFREYFYITNKNADEWSTIPIPDLPKPAKVKKAAQPPVVNPSSLMPPL